MTRVSHLAAQAVRVAVTLSLAAGAGLAGWKLWDFYTLAPWTRDARVQVNVVEVAPDVSGLITSINVVDNQKVSKGEVLFVIDQQRFTLALEKARANLVKSQLALQLAQDNATRDQQILMRDAGAISAKTGETSRTKAAAAEAELALARTELATAQLDLQRSTVVASVNGYVTNLVATVGDYAMKGNGVLALVDSDSFYVSAFFMETKLPQIHVGDAAEIQLMAGGPPLRGAVQGISRAIASPTTAHGGLLASVDPNFEWIRLAQRIPVRVAIDQGPGQTPLAAGMSATVVIRPSPPAR
jgi:RND family efflux transporter MFP subunit